MGITYLIIALLIGIGTPVQTAINSRLRSYVISPYLASLVSFGVGIVFLFFMLLATKHTVLIPREIFLSQPWWVWFGGVFAVGGLTGYVLLFPYLGGVQTVVMPMLGQILMGILIDSFGWFDSLQIPFSISRASGIALVIAGIFIVIMLGGLLKKKEGTLPSASKEVNRKWMWQILGVLTGMMIAIQSSINGRLATALDSATHAAFFSFAIGLSILFLLSFILRHPLTNITAAIRMKAPWWVWTGGVFGSLFIIGYAFLIPIIGTGTVIIISLFGQISASLVIDRYGLLGAKKLPITAVQITGLLIMLAGVIMIRMM